MLSVKNPHYINDSFDQPRAFIFFKTTYMNFLEFAFQSFWHFAGTVFLLSIFVQWKPFGGNRSLSARDIKKIVEDLKKKKSD